MDFVCGCFLGVSEARHKRGVASMKFSHFEAFPCLSAGGYSTEKSTANNSTNPQRHPPRNPQLNQQISTAKSTAEAGRYDLSASLGPWAVEIHFRYSTFFHAGFVGPLQTYSYNRTPKFTRPGTVRARGPGTMFDFGRTRGVAPLRAIFRSQVRPF